MGEHVEAECPEEARAVRARALARFHGPQRDGGIQAEGERLHEPGARRFDIAAHESQVERALGTAAHKLAQGVGRLVARRYAQRSCEVVARTQGQDSQTGPSRIVHTHEPIDRLMDDAVTAQDKHGVVCL